MPSAPIIDRADAETLDGQINVIAPENVAFHYEVAGPFRRLPAYLIDVFLKCILFLGFLWLGLWFFSVVRLQEFGEAAALLLFFGLNYLYGGLFETFWNGQTPGKRMMRLRVLSVDGRPINALQAFLRNILRDVDTMPFALVPGYTFQWVGLYWVALISMAATARFQRLGDLATGVMVVIEQRKGVHGAAAIREAASIELAARIPIDFEVTRTLGRALAMYVERRTGLSPLRRAEVARHLAVPLAARMRLPPDTNADHLLCALYYRTFIAAEKDDRIAAEAIAAAPVVS